MACLRDILPESVFGKRRRGRLEAKVEAFDRLFPQGAQIERVATGFQFTEGPLWCDEGRHLLFSDIPANRILQMTPEGRVSTFRHPSGHANGLTHDREGRLIACEHSNRRVSRTETDGTVTVIAEHFDGRKLNSPNDVVVRRDGSVYFTDPPYGIQPHLQEQPVQGVYRLPPDREHLALVAADFEGPNGLAFSPDEARLYIGDSSSRRHVRVFDVQADGNLANGRLFHDMRVKQRGSPDGMKVDTCGRLYCTGARGVWVFDVDGVHMGTICTPEKPSNCAWGDEDRQTLYITAPTSVYRVRVNTPGTRAA